MARDANAVLKKGYLDDLELNSIQRGEKLSQTMLLVVLGRIEYDYSHKRDYGEYGDRYWTLTISGCYYHHSHHRNNTQDQNEFYKQESTRKGTVLEYRKKRAKLRFIPSDFGKNKLVIIAKQRIYSI